MSLNQVIGEMVELTYPFYDPTSIAWKIPTLAIEALVLHVPTRPRSRTAQNSTFSYRTWATIVPKGDDAKLLPLDKTTVLCFRRVQGGAATVAETCFFPRVSLREKVQRFRNVGDFFE